MSLVNKMLQELDRRHAAEPVAATPESILGQRVRPTQQAAIGSEWFWRVLAVLIIVALGWVAWVGWHLMPRSSVTPLALKSAGQPRPAVQAARAPAPPAVAQPPAVAVQIPAPAQPQAVGAASPAQPVRPDTFALARELSTPVRERPASAASSPDRRTPGVMKPVPAQHEPAAEPTRAKAAPKPAAKAEPVSVRAASGKIDRRDSTNPREQAEAEFRRGVTFVNQGRMAEGMEAFRAALTLDPSYETARQTQVSLLLDARRVDEAAASLQEGLALNESNLPFAMLLARIKVERNDVSGALALLQRHASGGANNAEYHSFVAALYQRLGRYKEAGDEYQNALRLAPQNAAWWVGLGMSLESQKRAKEAGDAFRRAKNSGPLGSGLAAYVDERLKALP